MIGNLKLLYELHYGHLFLLLFDLFPVWFIRWENGYICLAIRLVYRLSMSFFTRNIKNNKVYGNCWLNYFSQIFIYYGERYVVFTSVRWVGWRFVTIIIFLAMRQPQID